MGRAKEHFAAQPERVIYLADSRWRAQAIDQIAYISIDRTSDRSIVQGLTQLVLELRELGAPVSNTTPKTYTIPEIAGRTRRKTSSLRARTSQVFRNGIISFTQWTPAC